MAEPGKLAVESVGVDPITIIGSDGGLLDAPVILRSNLFIGNGERLDVVIDFSRYPVGSSVVLHNVAEEDGGRAVRHLLPDVMRFEIVRKEPDPTDVPAQLGAVERLQPDNAVMTRRFVLDFTEVCGRLMA